MVFSKRVLATLLLLVILLASGTGSEMKVEDARPAGLPGVKDEKRTCESQSHRFKGPCFSASNCGHVCRTEGFQFGKCRGIGRRCYCTKHC